MKRNRIILLTALVLLCLALSTSVFGADLASCTVNYGNEDGAFGNTQVSIYQIATMNDQFESQICPDFAKYNLEFRKDMSNAYSLSQTLAGYIALDQLAPYRTATTDENGLLTMEELPWGIYWIAVDDDVIENTTYSAQPSLLPLPCDDGEGGHLFHLDLFQKITKTTKPTPPPTPTPETSYTSLNVQKLWNDSGYESHRPADIQVTLLQDGKACDEVTLNKENNWKHTWTKLDDDSKYQVVEAEVPAAYTVAVEATGTGYLITNSIRNTPPEELIEIPEDDTPKNEPPKEGSSDEEIIIPEPDVPLASLPYTGLLTWPVPVMAGSGLGSCLLGLILRRKKDSDDEAE